MNLKIRKKICERRRDVFKNQKKFVRGNMNELACTNGGIGVLKGRGRLV